MIVQHTQAVEQMLNARWWARLFFREQNPKPFSYFLTDCSVVFWIEVEGISHERPFHINTRTSPIPTKVYKPATVTPRKTSAMTLSGSKWILLAARTGTFRRDLSRPISITREPVNRSSRKYKSELNYSGGLSSLENK